MRAVRPTEARKETFVSSVDGSVQYYAVLPAIGDDAQKGRALILSLHGASVEAINQATSYAPKTWAHIICPTNRRPYGFNWEDWGRTDALEVLALVRSRLRIDESRIYLTGHSMGGHGAYHLGSLFPDQFAAIGPSAGWISFWTYRVREKFDNPSRMRQMLMRPALASDTYAFARNYADMGVYILHGSDDDNVPVEQSRAMAQQLSGFHRDFVYHEQPGVGHWWDNSDEPGAACVDWPPMFDFFARHARPENEGLREVHFATPSPGVSSRYYWASIDAQTEQWKISRVDLRIDPGLRRVVGTTENVRRMTFRLSGLLAAGPFAVELDSQKILGISRPANGEFHFERSEGQWSATGEPAGSLKGPARSGTFRDAIRNNVVFVYGTSGSALQNLWAFAKSRFDAERFWYQGNGSVEVLADTECTVSGVGNRNVVLYGNAGTHRLWRGLLEDSPVQVSAGRVSAGGRVFTGDDISCIFVRPRKGSDHLSVGVVSGTGLRGMRGTNKMPYLLPGIGFPDLLVTRGTSYLQGEEAVLGAGFFGDDWSLEKGEFVWKEGE
jgi:pimeloyl-ACP methyl ester carboxylesterase